MMASYVCGAVLDMVVRWCAVSVGLSFLRAQLFILHVTPPKKQVAGSNGNAEILQNTFLGRFPFV